MSDVKILRLTGLAGILAAVIGFGAFSYARLLSCKADEECPMNIFFPAFKTRQCARFCRGSGRFT